MTDKHDSRKAKPGLVLFLLTLVFLGPMLFAWVLYLRADNVGFQTTNQGDLIRPTLPITDFEPLEIFSQAPYPLEHFKGHWTLVYLIPKICSQGCHENLFNMKQMHIALGKEAPRVKRAYMFLPNDVRLGENKLLADTYPDVDQFRVKESARDLFSQHSTDFSKVGTFYLVDPQGEVMMYHTGDMPTKAMMADIKRLLKVSQTG